MSRSYRKHPIIGVAGESEKWDKRKANRKFRKKSKHSIFNEDPYPKNLREISDNWAFSKDGKIYVNINCKYLRK